ncbi:putative Het domain protein [Seiridium cardinale]|uniref:Het domain protein n=1 Tax=Seiridium cardinale TaxID=138064 RepID=A0ABR2XRY3_9PEZI
MFCGLASPNDPSKVDYSRSSTELASLLQSWLFFGLMSECLGQDIDSQVFVRRCQRKSPEKLAGKPTIDIRVDNTFLIQFGERRKRLWNTLFEARRVFLEKELLENVLFAQNQVELLELHIKEKSDDFCLNALLVRMLLHVIMFQLEQPLGPVNMTAPSAQVIVQRMLAMGWCKQRVTFACRQFSYPALYYMSSLQRYLPRHIDHHECTNDTCKAKADDMEPTHRKLDCMCMAIEVQMSEVVRIIREGGIPLVRVQKQDQRHGVIQLEVIRCTPSSSYTAISHVWSDRQLSARRNALPQCQLEYLDSVLAELPPSSGKGLRGIRTLHNMIHNRLWKWGLYDSPSDLDRLFWLDTLCIPLGSEHSDLRTKAINSMDLIYAGADRVLVLDAELQTADVGQSRLRIAVDGLVVKFSQPHVIDGPSPGNLLEVAARLFASAWVGRAWTLQEGCLALECVFRTSRSFVILRYLSPEAYIVPYESQDDHWIRNLRWLPFRKHYRSICGNILPQIGRAYQGYSASLLFGWVLCLLISIPRSFYRYWEYITPLKGYSVPRLPATVEEEVFRDLVRSIRSSVEMEHLDDNPFSTEISKEEKFRQAWSSLQTRSTTETEDLFTIVANLAGFNAGYIAQSTTVAERMRSIIFSMKSIPLGILFSSYEKKYGDGAAHPDRWIPIGPVGPLLSTSKLIFTHKGLVLKDVGSKPSEEIFLLPTSTSRSSTFRLQDSAPPNTQFAKMAPGWWVEAFMPDNDRLVLAPNVQLCVILSLDDRYPAQSETRLSQYRGARFFVTGQENDTISLQYDCALRAVQSSDMPAWWTGDPDAAYELRRIPLDWKVLIETGMTHPTVYPIRPPNPLITSQTKLITLAFATSLIWLAIEVAILVKIRKAVLPRPNDDIPVSPDLDFTIGRIDDTVSSGLTALCVLLLVCPGLLVSSYIHLYILKFIGYEAWVSTFAAGWTPHGKQNWRWALINYNVYILNLIPSMWRLTRTRIIKLRGRGRSIPPESIPPVSSPPDSSPPDPVSPDPISPERLNAKRRRATGYYAQRRHSSAARRFWSREQQYQHRFHGWVLEDPYIPYPRHVQPQINRFPYMGRSVQPPESFSIPPPLSG